MDASVQALIWLVRGSSAVAVGTYHNLPDFVDVAFPLAIAHGDHLQVPLAQRYLPPLGPLKLQGMAGSIVSKDRPQHRISRKEDNSIPSRRPGQHRENHSSSEVHCAYLRQARHGVGAVP